MFDMKSRRKKVGMGRDCGRIMGCVGVADTLTVFFLQYIKDVYSAVMSVTVVSYCK